MKKTISGTIYHLLHSFQFECSNTSSHEEFMQIKNEYTDRITTEVNDLIDTFMQNCEEKVKEDRSYLTAYSNEVNPVSPAEHHMLLGKEKFIDDIRQIADELKKSI